MASSGLENAIRELEAETKRIRQAIAALREFRPQAGGAGRGRRRGRLSAEARKRISLAAKKRWAALRASQKKG